MDKIQEALIKAGRKDLAQDYYKKVAYSATPRNKQEAADLILNLKNFFKRHPAAQEERKYIEQADKNLDFLNTLIKGLTPTVASKIAKLNMEKEWEADENIKTKKLIQIMKKNGLSDVTKELYQLTFVLPWFVDTNAVLEEFWSMNHAFWSEDVKIGRKGHDIFLIDWQGNVLQLQLKVTKK